ncbi:MAG: LTA synthase family protein [Gammaproteobacteria bacterium]|nr:MAG: LTA synthase family protein [Gammaproteobacteria bacterium]
MGWVLGLVLLFEMLRAGLLLRNVALAETEPGWVLAQAFLVGLRFDFAVASILLLPWLLWAMLPRIGWQYLSFTPRYLPWLLTLLWSPFILMSLSEYEFYREFHERYNQLALQYIVEDAATVSSMVWNGYPVITYVLIWSLLSALLFWWIRTIMVKAPIQYSGSRYIRSVLPWSLVMLVLLVGGSRGGLQRGAPIRWGDAFFSKSDLANHLALNSVYMFGNAVLERMRPNASHYWLKKLAVNDARDIVREMVLVPGDKLLVANDYPLLRQSKHTGQRVVYRSTPINVVLILMESFSAEFVGALGANNNVTPVFDGLAKHGILFDRFFSQGTHTHQGMFATVSSFPNLPGYEYLMQNNLGRQKFRSFPAVLSDQGFSSVYVYNGSFLWDNQKGFFTNQGINHFVGRDDYVDPIFRDPTWGVSDEDMFIRAVSEIDSLVEKGPAFALLQTVSNHAPFKLPEPAPFADIHGPERLMERLNGVRYSDYALGRFFELAAKKAWYKDTLFVILGDHGFGYEAPKARLDLAIFHIPLLLYYPGDMHAAGRREHIIGSQVDVLPTIMGLIGSHVPHQSWGRNLFATLPDDKGWAVVKPSGSQQIAGIIVGDEYWVETPGMKNMHYRYSLNPWFVEDVPQSEESSSQQYKKLHSYIQMGLTTLINHRAGAPTAVLGGVTAVRP